ncbi:helix-turn-helix domain-containing protein [Stigmatella aurantiaca]|uniref:helix-turn-helix domain-containing protein n=1 Tax=Stigmatella aurantiaca TaxID=41 RepID=UPI001FE5545B|nr:helix-turn-helix domain-containing protein [Stigmatella aurantiaca]
MQDERTEQRIARRARTLLAMADPATVVSELAERLGQDRSSIWALCRRFEALGVEVVEPGLAPSCTSG